jgi:hypothetical protein
MQVILWSHTRQQKVTCGQNCSGDNVNVGGKKSSMSVRETEVQKKKMTEVNAESHLSFGGAEPSNLQS